MPRRKISQREAHALKRQVAQMRKLLYDLRAPALCDAKCRREFGRWKVSEHGRGMFAGLRTLGKPILAATVSGDELIVYVYDGGDDAAA